MFTINFNTLLALSLLMTPTDDVKYVVMRPIVKEVASTLEIFDERERLYLLFADTSFPTDMILMRRRYQDFKDSPSLGDARRFPSMELCSVLIEFNRVYGSHLESRQALELHHRDWYAKALEENNELYHIWDTIREANTPYYVVTMRRTALKNLRDLIGKEDYYAGRLPPPAPIWRFEE